MNKIPALYARDEIYICLAHLADKIVEESKTNWQRESGGKASARDVMEILTVSLKLLHPSCRYNEEIYLNSDQRKKVFCGEWRLEAV